MGLGGALGAPATAFQYDWNMLPIGQQLWLEHLLSYEKFPPLQAPASYNLSEIIEQVKKANAKPRGRVAPRCRGRCGRPDRTPAKPGTTWVRCRNASHTKVEVSAPV